MATIYKIYCRDSEITDCYVGSTEDFTERCGNHKSRCNNPNDPSYNYNVYTFIRANLGMDNFVIEPIYECNVEDRYIEEQRWFELLKPTLNTNYPNRSSKQYYNDNKQYYEEYRKQYYIDNKEKISEQCKQYNIDNRERYNEYQTQYRIDNKQQISEYKKQYYENNKEKLKIKIECECGALVRKEGINRHRKTNKHQNYINSKL
jgi:hypothetical protein